MTILDQLADHAWARCRLARQTEPADRLRARALALPAGDFAFERALKKPGLSFICECKRASPSKGLIAPEYPYTRIAAEYEAAPKKPRRRRRGGAGRSRPKPQAEPEA